MPVTLLTLFDFIGTVAFAISGALVGVHKKMDIFGVNVLAVTTACGGGMIRDLIIGCIPPKMFQNPVFVLVAVVMVFTFFGMVNSVVGSSMYPTLHDKDIMLAYRLGYTPSQGDVVVIRKESFMEEAIVKRVIATEGQEVEINYDTNTVYVDGVAMEEPYINQEDTDVMEEKQGMVYKEFTVPEGSFSTAPISS